MRLGVQKPASCLTLRPLLNRTRPFPECLALAEQAPETVGFPFRFGQLVEPAYVFRTVCQLSGLSRNAEEGAVFCY